MTVASDNAYRELTWTGVETSFNPQFTAERVEDVGVSYQDILGNVSPLVRGTHFNVTLDGDNNVTVTPASMPVASVSSPGTLLIERNSQVLQSTDFDNLEDFDANVHETLFDRCIRLAGEFRRDIARRVGPFFTMAGVVDFRPYRVSAADPVNDQDLATKAWVLVETGLINLIAYVNAAAASATAAAASAAAALVSLTSATAARDKAQAWSDTAEDTFVPGTAEYSAYNWSRKALAQALICTGFASTLTTAIHDWGNFQGATTVAADWGDFH